MILQLLLQLVSKITKYLHFDKSIFFVLTEFFKFIIIVELKKNEKYGTVSHESIILKCNLLYS